MRGSGRTVFVFGAASLAAVAAGCVAMAQSGVGASSWLRNAAAWVVGAALCAILSRFGRPRWSTAALLIGTAAIVATLFAADVDGVHRWIDLGPLHINAAALFLPPMIVALARRRGQPIAIAVMVLVAAVLVAQPDASQLTAFAAAGCWLLVLGPRLSVDGGEWPVGHQHDSTEDRGPSTNNRPPSTNNRGPRTNNQQPATLVAALAAIVAVWMRPDPLQPVPEVEQIFGLCRAVSPLLAAMAAIALAIAALAPLTARAEDDAGRDASIALCIYFIVVAIAPLFGWFPVPLVGLGMSFPIGWWLGIAALRVSA